MTKALCQVPDNRPTKRVLKAFLLRALGMNYDTNVQHGALSRLDEHIAEARVRTIDLD